MSKNNRVARAARLFAARLSVTCYFAGFAKQVIFYVYIAMNSRIAYSLNYKHSYPVNFWEQVNHSERVLRSNDSNVCL